MFKHPAGRHLNRSADGVPRFQALLGGRAGAAGGQGSRSRACAQGVTLAARGGRARLRGPRVEGVVRKWHVMERVLYCRTRDLSGRGRAYLLESSGSCLLRGYCLWEAESRTLSRNRTVWISCPGSGSRTFSRLLELRLKKSVTGSTWRSEYRSL